MRRAAPPGFFNSALLQHVDDSSKRIMLVAPRMHIGRGVSGANDIALPAHDGRTSRLHATLICDGGVWMLEDDSLNGTRINGQKLHHQLVVLNDGDYIQIGNGFHYVFKHLDMTDPGHSTTHHASDLLNSPVLEDESSVPTTGFHISAMGYAYRDGARLPQRLSHSEFRILKRLLQSDGETVPFDELGHAAWGAPRSEPDVLALVRRLWEKIEPNAADPRHVFIQPGVGVVIISAGLNS